jgi:hypothetical protein
MQAESEPAYPLLYSQQGFIYCDLLLTEAERAAWQVSYSGGARSQENGDAQRATLQAVSKRAAQTLKWADQANASLLSIALDHLTLGRAALYATVLEGSSPDPSRAPLQHAVAGLRRAGLQHELPRGLLTRAWLRSLEGKPTGHDSAQGDLDEAWEIAERGPMKLHMADTIYTAPASSSVKRITLGIRTRMQPRAARRTTSPPRASSSRNAATGDARRSCRMHSGRWAGAELNPSLPPPG